MQKKFVLFSVVGVVLAVGGFFALQNPMGGLVKLAIEEFAPKLTKSRVLVDHVDISASDGQGVMTGFKLGNPEGFSTEYALKADKIELGIDTASLLKDVVHIKKAVILAPDLTYEKGEKGSNFDVLQQNVVQYIRGKHKDENAPDKKFIIDKLVLTDITAHYGDSVSVPLPDIELNDVGKQKGGATMAEVTKNIIAEISVQVVLAIPKAAANGVAKFFKGIFGE